jgi:hypothetical protein
MALVAKGLDPPLTIYIGKYRKKKVIFVRSI